MSDVALLFHLLGAFPLVAGMAVAGVTFEAARRRKTPREIALLLGYGPAGVEAAVGLLLGSVVLGAVGGRQPKQARRLAVVQSDRAEVSTELRALLDARLARGCNALSLLLIVVIVVLMVTKPGAS